MMHIRVIAVGRIKEKFLQEGIAGYEKRLRPYVKLQVVELAEEKRPHPASRANESAAMEAEGRRILGAIPGGSFIISLDVNGESWSSGDLAALFGERELSGQNPLTFVIGGDLGLSPGVIARSNLRLSLSHMTFTHPMTRFILLEQVYRAFRILRGEPYHK